MTPFRLFFILIETIWPKIWAKPLPMNEKGPLPVDVRCSVFAQAPYRVTMMTQLEISPKAEYLLIILSVIRYLFLSAYTALL